MSPTANGRRPRGEAVRRRAAILELVRAETVPSQQRLGQLLKARGFSVAQPTLSRDIAELGLARTPRGYTAALAVPPAPAGEGPNGSLDRALAYGVLSVQAAGTLVVVKTPPAGAHTVARTLDGAGMPGVVGTIAGDDTVFIATPDAAAALRVERRLQSSFMPAGRRPARA